MPYDVNADLPPSVRSHLPAHAQDIFREAFNHAYAAHAHDPRQEEAAFRIAWAAVEAGLREDRRRVGEAVGDGAGFPVARADNDAIRMGQRSRAKCDELRRIDERCVAAKPGVEAAASSRPPEQVQVSARRGAARDRRRGRRAQEIAYGRNHRASNRLVDQPFLRKLFAEFSLQNSGILLW